MGRFIRRLFVLLILFIIVFLIYRYINPVGASMFVDKIKSMGDIIPDFGGSGLDENIDITGETIKITGDISKPVEENANEGDLDIEADTGNQDLGWLEELNVEIEKILDTDKDGTGDIVENGEILTGDTLTGESKNNNVLTGVNSKEITGDTGDKVLTGDIITGNNIEDTSSTNAGLTDTDYKQVKDVFGNLVE